MKVELLYPDRSLLNSRQVPLVKNIFFTSSEVFAGPENDGKTFTVKATYAGGSATSNFKYLGSGTQHSSQEKQDLKYSAKLSMSATINGRKVMILSLKNPKGSDATIYGTNIKIDKGSIKSAVDTAGWKAKID